MSGAFAGLILVIGLYLHWVVPWQRRNLVILFIGLAIGSLLWPEATVIAFALVALQSLPGGLSQAVPRWLMVALLLSPLVFQKVWQTQAVGLSYVSFLALALYLDTQKSGEMVSWKDRLWFSSFFPLIPAGPIERWSNVRPQLPTKRVFDRGLFVSGLLLISLGIFKKVVIADRLSDLAVDSQKDFLSYSGIGMWAYLGLCLIQIYCDFSAVIDLARGVCRLFGIEVMDNFDRPYLADSVQDIWQRWHISLVSWLRETVYNPIALRTRSVTLASAAVLLLVGLWHGVKWQMVLWALYWLLLFWWAVFLRTKGWRLGIPLYGRRALCVLAMAFSTVFMIPDSLSELSSVVGRVFFVGVPSPTEQKTLSISQVDLLIAIVGFSVVLVFEMFTAQLAVNYRSLGGAISSRIQALSILLIIGFLFLTVAFGASRWVNFVYMRY